MSYYEIKKMPKIKTESKLRTGTCSICQKVISYDPGVTSWPKAIMEHKQTEHMAEMAEIREKAAATNRQKFQERQDEIKTPQEAVKTPQDKSSETKTPKPREEVLKTAPSAEAANVFIIRPQKYDINSLFILIAKHICENEWKWPEMSVSQWLDAYLFHTMRQRGYVIGAYQKSEEVSDGKD